MEMSNLLNVTDIAKRLRLSVSMVYQLVAERKISHRRIGGAIRFAESDLEEYLESVRHGRKSGENWSKKTNRRNRRTVNRNKDWF